MLDVIRKEKHNNTDKLQYKKGTDVSTYVTSHEDRPKRTCSLTSTINGIPQIIPI